MADELVATEVQARLATLRRLHVPEHLDDARRRLDEERPRSEEPFERRVARSLAELRALCELAQHLRRPRRL